MNSMDTTSKPAKPDVLDVPKPRRFKWLRICWSAVLVVLAATLVALWVRSYRWNDLVYCQPRNGTGTSIGSDRGKVYFARIYPNIIAGLDVHSWSYTKTPISIQELGLWAFEWKSSKALTFVSI